VKTNQLIFLGQHYDRMSAIYLNLLDILRASTVDTPAAASRLNQ
jgi:hypothetical protein